MKHKCASFISSLLAIALLASAFTFAAPDEGMFPPDQIAGLPLAKRGLKIKPAEIYNPNAGGLTDAVIRLDQGCTAEFVSPDGLILTNHHCGFDALVTHSTQGNDLVETGFNAGNRAGEFRAMAGEEPYSITLTERIENVTDRITAGTSGLTGEAIAAAIKKNTDDLTAAEKARHPGTTITIQALNNGYFYYLYQTTQIKDIRFVYAPPRNIGVFGGDPDNFEWTRHTGDFTFLRAYVGPDGKPADYSANNVPYHPKKYFTMNIGGLRPDDFVFVLGFPGGTTRYRESWSIRYARDANFPFLYKWLRTITDELKQIGSTDEAKRIAFQGDVASLDNSRKLYEGGAKRLQLAGLVQARETEEASLAKWIAADAKRQQKYASLLTDLKQLSETTNAAQERDVIMRRLGDPNSNGLASVPLTPSFVAALQAITAVKQGRKLTDQQKAQVLAGVKESFAKREPLLEKEVLKFFLRQLDELPADQRFAATDQRFAGKTPAERRANEDAWAHMVATGDLTKPENIMALYDMSWDELKQKHPFGTAVAEERLALAARTANFASKIDALRVRYQQALAEMRGSIPYPDANFTMRFTYGNIRGYRSREAEQRLPFTTIKGIIEKDTGKPPFDAPKKLVDLQNAHDFGRYGEGDSVVVNFLATTDIIGGNSGSPVLNGNGEQVGIVFDGNFEGLGNDFYYDPDVNRTIACDIRYVLFVTEKFSGAKWIVDEMKVVAGSARAAGTAAGVSNPYKLDKQDDRVVRSRTSVPY